MSEDTETYPGLEDADVVTKYKMGAEMVNRALKQVVSACVAGANVFTLCKYGDQLMLKETGSVFTKKVEGQTVPKGISFPTCISVNNVIGHFSPLASEPDQLLADGDVVKIDMGLHLAGYISVVAHTLVVGATKEKPVTGPAANAILAAYHAAEAVARLIKPGNSSDDVVKVVNQIAAAYGVTPVEDMSTHSLTCFELMGEKMVVYKPSDAQRSEVPKVKFEANETYAVEVFMSTGEGKAKPTGQRTNVYQATGDSYQLKGKHSRTFFAEVQKFDRMAFSLRAFESEAQARMGVKECVEHKIVRPYEVIQDQAGSICAQFRMVVLLMPNGNLKITGLDFDPALYQSEHKLEDEAIVKLLAQSLSSKAKKKNKKKKATGASGEEAAAAEDATEED